MKGNIVSFEAEYFLTKEKEAREAMQNEDFEKTLNIIKEPLFKIEGLDDVELYCPQNAFDQIIFLNLLGKEVHQTSFSKINYYEFYLIAASSYVYLNNLEKAKEYYEKAIKLNPASSVARISKLKIDIKTGNFENVLNDIKDAMFFAYSRNDIGEIFEIAGDYLSHENDYEMALVAYHFSIVYKVDDSVAVKITDTACKGNIDDDSKDWLSDYYMKKFYNTYKIPLMPNEKLVLLAESMGKDAFKNKAYGVSMFSFNIAYNLTLDEKYKKELDEVSIIAKSSRK